jgi:dienelactone hydrolase
MLDRFVVYKLMKNFAVKHLCFSRCRRLVELFLCIVGLSSAQSAIAGDAISSDAWGNYTTRSGKLFVIGHSPNSTDGLFLFDAQTEEFSQLKPDGNSLCARRCTQRIMIGKNAIDIRSGNRSIRAFKQPITVEDMSIQSGGVTLVGRITRPSTAGRHPAFVLLGGSGCDLRDDFRIYPYLLVRAGYVVYAFDKRGCGESGGKGAMIEEGIDLLAKDAVAAVEALRARSDVDPKRISVLGISHGGWVAIEAAHQDPQIASVVPIVGGGVTLRRAFTFEVLTGLQKKGYGVADVSEASRFLESMLDSMRDAHVNRIPDLFKANADKPWFKDTPLAPFATLPREVMPAIAAQRWETELSYDPAKALAGS